MGELEEIKTLLQSNLSLVNSTMQMHMEMIKQLREENSELKKKLSEIPHSKRSADPLKEEVITKLKRNRKRMIKNKIVETIKFKNLTIPEVKEIIVDQHNYCSKASFYRYLEELIKQDYIHIGESNIIKIKPLVEIV